MVNLIGGKTHDKNKSGLSGRRARRMLTLACVVGAFALGACEGIESGKQAQKDAEEAARRQASAGKPRGTDELIKQVADASDWEALKKQAAASPDLYKKFVVQNSTADDLKAALAKIQSALKFDASDALQSSLESEHGQIALQLSDAKLNALRDELLDFEQRAIALQSQAQAAADLAGQADAIEKNAKAPADGAVTAAQGVATQKTKDTAAARSEVEGVQQQIAGLLEQSKQVYAATDAAFEATKTMKGQAAIDAGRKVVEDRKAGDKFAEDAALLEPRLIDAQRALVKAEIDQKEAEAKLTEAQGTLKSDQEANRQATARVAELRDAAKKMVTDDAGVTARYKEMTDLSVTIEAQLKEALTAGNEAMTAFKSASDHLRSARSELNDKITKAGLDVAKADGSLDPLKKIYDDPRPTTIASWNKAAAADQVGRINMVGQVTMSTLAQAAMSAAAAQKAGGGDGPSPKAAADAASAYGKAAAEAFTTADAAASEVSGNSKELGNIQWIGLSFRAVAGLGLAQAQNEKKGGPVWTAATRTASEAVAKNPDMRGPMERLTGPLPGK